jgi:hypothetical protein
MGRNVARVRAPEHKFWIDQSYLAKKNFPMTIINGRVWISIEKVYILRTKYRIVVQTQCVVYAQRGLSNLNFYNIVQSILHSNPGADSTSSSVNPSRLANFKVRKRPQWPV